MKMYLITVRIFFIPIYRYQLVHKNILSMHVCFDILRIPHLNPVEYYKRSRYIQEKVECELSIWFVSRWYELATNLLRIRERKKCNRLHCTVPISSIFRRQTIALNRSPTGNGPAVL